jgi:hypothetical protein
MRSKIVSVLALIILLAAQGLRAQEYSGKGLYLLGDGAAANGRGGTGVSSFGADLFHLNPASIAAWRDGDSASVRRPCLRLYNPDISMVIRPMGDISDPTGMIKHSR